jgi:AcrR family transcriptional regulator
MTSPDTAPAGGRARTARERARTELTLEIKQEARRQLAEAGANGLSLRAVARQLGMVSSALYRYYPSRDDLLTALIIDAYDAIGGAAERAVAAPGATARERWSAACHAIRDWARSHPHEYALIYGSPVPGYRAPQTTIGPAARVPVALTGLLVSAAASGELIVPPDPAGAVVPPLDDVLTDQAAALADALGIHDVPPQALVGAAIAWAQLFGMISFELFGQFVGSFEPADALFARAVAQLAALAGLGAPLPS